MNGMLSVLVQFSVGYCLARFQIGLLVCLINVRSLIIMNTCKGGIDGGKDGKDGGEG